MILGGIGRHAEAGTSRQSNPIVPPFLKIGVNSFRRTNGGAGLPPPLMTESSLRSR